MFDLLGQAWKGGMWEDKNVQKGPGQDRNGLVAEEKLLIIEKKCF